MTPLRQLALYPTLLSLSACGAIFSSSTAVISVNSEPSGAEVVINGNPMGRTPLQAEVSNRESQTIQLNFDNGESSTCILPTKLGVGYVVLDVLFTGLIGVVVDAATNGWTELARTSCMVSARRAESPPTTEDSGPVASRVMP